MSRQTNFYAAPGDTDRIHQWLLTEFPGLTLVSRQRGSKEDTIPMDASKPRAFWHHSAGALVPIWAKPLLQTEDLSPTYPNEFVIRSRSNPIIEYRPCPWDEETKTVTRSRFYWAYTDELPPEAIRQVLKLLRWVQRNTVPAKGTFIRFFPDAARDARFVRPHLAEPAKPNPLYAAHLSKEAEHEQVD